MNYKDLAWLWKRGWSDLGNDLLLNIIEKNGWWREWKKRQVWPSRLSTWQRIELRDYCGYEAEVTSSEIKIALEKWFFLLFGWIFDSSSGTSDTFSTISKLWKRLKYQNIEHLKFCFALTPRSITINWRSLYFRTSTAFEKECSHAIPRQCLQGSWVFTPSPQNGKNG